MSDEVASKRLTALVVEDDERIAELLRFVLERDGIAVRIASDGLAAAALLETSTPPSLVLLDLMLPHVNGFDLLRALKSRAGWQAVPVIVLSARAQAPDIVAGLDHGADDYLVKPFMPEELRARVRRVLR